MRHIVSLGDLVNTSDARAIKGFNSWLMANRPEWLKEHQRDLPAKIKALQHIFQSYNRGELQSAEFLTAVNSALFGETERGLYLPESDLINIWNSMVLVDQASGENVKRLPQGTIIIANTNPLHLALIRASLNLDNNTLITSCETGLNEAKLYERAITVALEQSPVNGIKIWLGDPEKISRPEAKQLRIKTISEVTQQAHYRGIKKTQFSYEPIACLVAESPLVSRPVLNHPRTAAAPLRQLKEELGPSQSSVNSLKLFK